MDDGRGDGRSDVDRAVTVLAERLELTQRQAEIAFLLVAQRKTIGETACVLSLDARTVEDSIEQVLERLGVSWVGLAEHVSAAMWQGLNGGSLTEGLAYLGLSPCQEEIAREILEGASIDETARRRDCHVGTIKAHIARMYQKLDIHSSLELAHKAHQARQSRLAFVLAALRDDLRRQAAHETSISKD